MKPYFDLMQSVKDTGFKSKNERTGEICTYLTGTQVKFDLRHGYFPANQRRKVGIKSALGELLGFFRGYTNAADFEKVGSKVWYANANETKAWLANPYRKGENDLGRIYSSQWTEWRDARVATTLSEAASLKLQGFEIELEGVDGSCLMVRYINQLDEILYKLLTDPSDRRIILNGWNVAELDQCALVPCHISYDFVANPDNSLDVVCHMRSWDMHLAFNIQLAAIFVSIVARLVGRVAGTVTVNATNAHLYSSAEVAVDEVLSRTDDFYAPTLELSSNIKQVTLDNYKGAFARIDPEDIWLEGYKSHPPTTPVRMAA